MPDAPRYSFDPRVQRYRDVPSGRFVPEQAVRGQVDQVLDVAASRMRGLTEQLQAGSLSLEEWRVGMQAQIKATHIVGGVAARGGFEQMSQADYGWIGQRIRAQYEYLDNFAAQLASGHQPLDGTALRRAEMYGEAGRGTHREMERRLGRLRGEDQERNILGPADHCSSCLGATSKGWVPIGTLPAVGARKCLTRCRCVIKTRRKPAEQVAA